jgi:hypothetical protein
VEKLRRRDWYSKIDFIGDLKEKAYEYPVAL